MHPSDTLSQFQVWASHSEQMLLFIFITQSPPPKKKKTLKICYAYYELRGHLKCTQNNVS